VGAQRAAPHVHKVTRVERPILRCISHIGFNGRLASQLSASRRRALQRQGTTGLREKRELQETPRGKRHGLHVATETSVVLGARHSHGTITGGLGVVADCPRHRPMLVALLAVVAQASPRVLRLFGVGRSGGFISPQVKSSFRKENHHGTFRTC
jgi:hypothetical protein